MLTDHLCESLAAGGRVNSAPPSVAGGLLGNVPGDGGVWQLNRSGNPRGITARPSDLGIVLSSRVRLINSLGDRDPLCNAVQMGPSGTVVLDRIHAGQLSSDTKDKMRPSRFLVPPDRSKLSVNCSGDGIQPPKL